VREPLGVLHLVHQFGAGGAEGQLLARLRGHPEGFRPVVACLQKAGPLLESVGVPVEEFALRGGLAQIDTAQVILKLAAFMEREGVRLVHANDHRSNLLAVPAARLVRAKVICSLLDLRQQAFRAQRLAEALALRGADAVMVNARCMRERCVRDDGVPANKVYVVHNGIDLAAFDAAAKLDPELPAGRPAIAMIGNLHAAKGHLDLIEAVARLRAQVPDLLVVCAGEGPMRPLLEQQIAFHGLRETVLLPGHRGDVPALLARAQIACAPSRSEGFSSSIVEAMAAGLPVVATEVGGTPELVQEGETGLLVPPHDPQALAERLLSLLRDPGRARALGAAGRKRVEQEFALPALSKRLGELYRTVLGEGCPQRAAA
jgi:glycosyltransferase involved in cell wall biosynthesis